MGLLSTEVEITLNGRIFKHLEIRGYELPRSKDKIGRICVPRGSKMIVKVKDLLPNSQVMVKIKCDYCGKEKEVSYQSYIQNNRDGICYCQHCASSMQKGENSPTWNFNKTKEEREISRKFDGYVDFVKNVLARDDYTCKCCKKRGLANCVHHLNSYNWCIEGRIDPKNAVTLCETCHGNFHSLYGYGDNTKEQYEEWIGYALDNLDVYNGELPTKRQVYCIEEDKIYDGAIDVANSLNINISRIYDICNHKIHTSYCINKNGEVIKYNRLSITAKGKHFLWYDEYIKMSKEEINNILKQKRSNSKSVVCITTGIVFETAKIASIYYNCNKNIYKCCKGEYKTCGQLLDGTRLQWMYYEDYLKENDMTDEEAHKSLFFVE